MWISLELTICGASKAYLKEKAQLQAKDKGKKRFLSSKSSVTAMQWGVTTNTATALKLGCI